MYSKSHLTWFMAWYFYIKYIWTFAKKQRTLEIHEHHRDEKGLCVDLGYFFNGSQKYKSVVPREIQFTRTEKRKNNIISNSGPHANYFSSFLCTSCETFAKYVMLWERTVMHKSFAPESLHCDCIYFAHFLILQCSKWKLMRRRIFVEMQNTFHLESNYIHLQYN